MAYVFHLKRYLEYVPNIPSSMKGASLETIYNLIKNHKKLSEYREASDYWDNMLLTPEGQVWLKNQLQKALSSPLSPWDQYIDVTKYARHRKAIFIEGYQKGKISTNPHLKADVIKIQRWINAEIYEIIISDAKEIKVVSLKLINLSGTFKIVGKKP